jgi:hypothetical protein
MQLEVRILDHNGLDGVGAFSGKRGRSEQQRKQKHWSEHRLN